MLIWEKNAASRGCDSNAIQREVRLIDKVPLSQRSWPVEGRTGPPSWGVSSPEPVSRQLAPRTGRRAGVVAPIYRRAEPSGSSPRRDHFLAAGRSFLEGFEDCSWYSRRGAALLRAVQRALRVGRGLARRRGVTRPPWSRPRFLGFRHTAGGTVPIRPGSVAGVGRASAPDAGLAGLLPGHVHFAEQFGITLLQRLQALGVELLTGEVGVRRIAVGGIRALRRRGGAPRRWRAGLAATSRS